MFGMGPAELAIVGIIAVLLFGKRLPEVAKSLGSSYREFRNGLNSLQSEIDFSGTDSYGSSSSSYQEESSYDDIDDHDEATAPKFEPPPSAPVADTSETHTPAGSAEENNPSA